MKRSIVVCCLIIICIISVIAFSHIKTRDNLSIKTLPLSENILFEMSESEVLNQLDSISKVTKNTDAATISIHSTSKIMDYDANSIFNFVNNKLQKVTYTINAKTDSEFQKINSHVQERIKDKKGFQNQSTEEDIRYSYGYGIKNVSTSINLNKEKETINITFTYYR